MAIMGAGKQGRVVISHGGSKSVSKSAVSSALAAATIRADMNVALDFQDYETVNAHMRDFGRKFTREGEIADVAAAMGAGVLSLSPDNKLMTTLGKDYREVSNILKDAASVQDILYILKGSFIGCACHAQDPRVMKAVKSWEEITPEIGKATKLESTALLAEAYSVDWKDYFRILIGRTHSEKQCEVKTVQFVCPNGGRWPAAGAWPCGEHDGSVKQQAKLAFLQELYLREVAWFCAYWGDDERALNAAATELENRCYKYGRMACKRAIGLVHRKLVRESEPELGLGDVAKKLMGTCVEGARSTELSRLYMALESTTADLSKPRTITGQFSEVTVNSENSEITSIRLFPSRHASASSQGEPASSQGEPASSLGEPASSLGEPAFNQGEQHQVVLERQYSSSRDKY